MDIAPITARIPVVSDRTGWSRSEVYRLLAAGKLRAVKNNRATLVIWQSVLDHLETLPPATFRAPQAA